MVQFLPATGFGAKFAEAFPEAFRRGFKEHGESEKQSKLLSQKHSNQLKLEEEKIRLKEESKKRASADLRKQLLGSELEEQEGIPDNEIQDQHQDKVKKDLADIWSSLDPAKKAIIAQENPQFATQLQKDVDLRERSRLKEKTLTQQQKQYENTQTSDYAKELRENSSQGREIKHAAEDIRRVLKKDKTGASGRNLAFKYLSSKHNPFAGLFQTEDTQAVISAAKTFAGGFKSLFGSKPTQAEFFWYENILPDILKDAATNEKALEYFERVADLNIKQQDIADDIVKENGGYRPIDLDRQVRERLKDDINKVIKEGEQIYSGKDLMEGYYSTQTGKQLKGLPPEKIDEFLKKGLIRYGPK